MEISSSVNEMMCNFSPLDVVIGLPTEPIEFENFYTYD